MMNLLFGVILVLAMPAFAVGQFPDSGATAESDILRLYFDCVLCDMDFFKNEVSFVEFVRQPQQAHVHVLVTTQGTGSGGTEYTLTFIGREKFLGLGDTLRHLANKSDTQDMIRQDLAAVLKLGLIRFASHTPVARHITVSYDAPATEEKTADPWDYWVFSASVDGNMDGQQSYKSSYYSSSLSANRVTEAVKINLSVRGSYQESKYDFEDYTYLDVTRSASFNSRVIWSIDGHWSAGSFIYGSHSVYGNTAFGLSLAPGVEYNIFPYDESTRRQLRIEYRPSVSFTRYIEETIFSKQKEWLTQESLTFTLSTKEPWGSSSVSIYGSHYFHDFHKYNLGIFGSLSVRVVEGFSVNFWGDYSEPHDQIGLRKGDVTDEEVLLRRQELETQYRYYFSIGFSYSFGSIYNSIVNPRFGGSSGGSTMIYYSD